MMDMRMSNDGRVTKITNFKTGSAFLEYGIRNFKKNIESEDVKILQSKESIIALTKFQN